MHYWINADRKKKMITRGISLILFFAITSGQNFTKDEISAPLEISDQRPNIVYIEVDDLTWKYVGAFGKEFATTHLKVNFPVIDEMEICEIDIEKGKRPLYLEVANRNGQKQKKFYVRSGNSSQELEIDEVASYVKNRFEAI